MSRGRTYCSGRRWQSRHQSICSDFSRHMLYQYNASREYDPSGSLEKITTRLLAINSADDVVNPPELGLMENLMPRVKRGRYVLIPTSDQTRGHGTHSLPSVWSRYLEEFLKELSTSCWPLARSI